jgi:DNA-directed RNA polymerase specialized sigma24 family protein
MRGGLERGDRVTQVQSSGSDFADFVAGSSRRLLGLAYLLSADRALADRLLEDALDRTYRHWPAVSRDGVPEAHVRQLLVDSIARRRSRRRPVSAPDPDGVPTMSAVAGLPTAQRVVLVLRYFEGLDDVQAAAVMGCSVKSVRHLQTRAISRLQTATTAGRS